MNESLSGPIIIGIATWLTYLIAFAGCRSAAWRKTLPDHPNHRSSHVRATSKAGGIAMIAAWSVGMIVVAVFIDPAAYLRAGSGIAVLTMFALVLGLADDALEFSPLVKFAGQAAIAALFVWIFNPLLAVPLPFIGEINLPAIVGASLTIAWIVGFMNAYNFMDGINGIAAGCTCIGMTVFAIFCAFFGALLPAAAAMLLTVACFGFLPMNFTGGRLFMGDNGSQAISFLIAALAIYAANITDGRITALVVPVIFMPFLFDVAWTLTHRLVRGQNVLVAHREHNYQLLLRLGRSHERVATLYISATFLCALLAGAMLMSPAYLHWLVPGVLFVIFALLAADIFRKADAAGLLASNGEVIGEADGAVDTAAVQDMQPAE